MKLKNLIAITFMAVFLSVFTGCDFFGTEVTESYESMFNYLWKDYNDTYALFEIRKVDWKKAYDDFYPEIQKCSDDKTFFEICSKMLYCLHDAHVYIKTPFESMNSGDVNTHLDAFSLSKTLDNFVTDVHSCGENIITYGKLISDETVGYIHIKAFNQGQTGIKQNQDWASDIDIALESLKNTKAIILDVRGNRGGLTGNVSRISGRFCSEDKVYAVSRTKNGPGKNDFGQSVELEIKKNGHWQYSKPVFLLTNAQTMSAGEEFVMALKTQSHVTQIGTPTCGVFSLSLERCLPNGWKYSVSVQKVTDGNGNCHEGIGLVPEDENLVRNSTEDDDRQMLRALEVIKTNL